MIGPNDFLFRRWARRYAELYVLKGQPVAELYADFNIKRDQLDLAEFRELVAQEINALQRNGESQPTQ